MAVDLYGYLVVDQLLYLEAALRDDYVLGLYTLIHLELVQSVSLRMLAHFLKVVDLLKNRHFQ